MLAFVKNKIFSKKWMVISLLIGNILLISIAACSPMYSDAVLQRMLNNNLVNLMETKGRYPGIVELRSSYNANVAGSSNYEKVEATADLADQLAQECEVPITEQVSILYKSDVAATHEAAGGTYKDNFDARLEAVSDLESHITMVSGDAP